MSQFEGEIMEYNYWNVFTVNIEDRINFRCRKKVKVEMSQFHMSKQVELRSQCMFAFAYAQETDGIHEDMNIWSLYKFI